MAGGSRGVVLRYLFLKNIGGTEDNNNLVSAEIRTVRIPCIQGRNILALFALLSKTICQFRMNIYDLFNDFVNAFVASNGAIIRKL
jgi:hypothetical protein